MSTMRHNHLWTVRVPFSANAEVTELEHREAKALKKGLSAVFALFAKYLGCPLLTHADHLRKVTQNCYHPIITRLEYDTRRV